MTGTPGLTTSGESNYPETYTPGNNDITNPAKLPDDFDPFKHLQQQYIPIHNALVKQWFADTEPSGGGEWQPNLHTPRNSSRVACTMTTGDNQLIMQMRHHLFWDLLGYGRKYLMNYYGSQDAVAPPVEGHPKVVLYFSQEAAAVPTGYRAVDMECSFRLMNETQLTFTKENAVTLAQRIKTQFITAGKGIKFVKGKTIYKYYDETHGYRLLVRGNTEADSIDLITRLLECQSFAFDENKLVESAPKKSNLTTPPTQEIMGKAVKKPRYRPIADLYFRYASVLVPGLDKPIFLVDDTGRHRSLA